MRNFGGKAHENIPNDFVADPHKYFYLSRFLYAFYILALFPALLALLLGLVALFGSTLVATAAALSAATAALFATAAACLMTACYTMAQNAFRRAGRFARISVQATAFSWTAATLLSLATLGFVLAGIAARRRATGRRRAAGNGRAVEGHGEKGFSRLWLGRRTGARVGDLFGLKRHHHRGGDLVEGGESVRQLRAVGG